MRLSYTNIDVNCDLGEGFGNDHQIMPLVSSCNIACGGHFGDEDSMKEAIELALTYGVLIGAHPSFPDKETFGRSAVIMSNGDLVSELADQLSVFEKVAREMGTYVHHIKAHGALYNIAATNTEVSEKYLEAVIRGSSCRRIYAPWSSITERLAPDYGIGIVYEAFADRSYNSDGTLVSRNHPEAMIDSESRVFDQIVKIAKRKQVSSIQGKLIPLEAQTYCVHSDHPNTPNILRYLHQHLPTAGIRIL